jgi:hypothetical protein
VLQQLANTMQAQLDRLVAAVFELQQVGALATIMSGQLGPEARARYLVFGAMPCECLFCRPCTDRSASHCAPA